MTMIAGLVPRRFFGFLSLESGRFLKRNISTFSEQSPSGYGGDLLPSLSLGYALGSSNLPCSCFLFWSGGDCPFLAGSPRKGAIPHVLPNASEQVPCKCGSYRDTLLLAIALYKPASCVANPSHFRKKANFPLNDFNCPQSRYTLKTAN